VAPNGTFAGETEDPGGTLEERWLGGGPAARPEWQRPIAAEVDRRLFARILFSFDTMPHHLPDTYLAALQQL
jgi:hypothetical protein